MTANYNTKQGLNHKKNSTGRVVQCTMPLSDKYAYKCTNLKISPKDLHSQTGY